MKVEILTENLKKAINVLERVTRKTLTLPVLQNVLMETEGNFLQLTTTNLETTIKWWILAKIEKKGKLAIPATFLANLINLIKSEKIELEGQNQNLILKTKDQTNQIQGQNPEDFPIIPKIEKNNPWTASIKKLTNGLGQVIDIPSISQIRPEISGLYFQIKKDKLKLVATDSFRLGEKTINLETPLKKDESFILPQATARELNNIAPQEEGRIQGFVAPNQVLFEVLNEETSFPKVHILSRLIEGQYPNYQEIIPKKYTTKVQLKKEEFETEIKRAGLFSGKVLEVRLTLQPKQGKIGFFSQSADSGSNQSYLKAKIEGEPLEAAFNYKFLLDGLNNLKSSEVVFELSGEGGPGVLKPVGDSTYLYILMPIKNT